MEDIIDMLTAQVAKKNGHNRGFLLFCRNLFALLILQFPFHFF